MFRHDVAVGRLKAPITHCNRIQARYHIDRVSTASLPAPAKELLPRCLRDRKGKYAARTWKLSVTRRSLQFHNSRQDLRVSRGTLTGQHWSSRIIIIISQLYSNSQTQCKLYIINLNSSLSLKRELKSMYLGAWSRENQSFRRSVTVHMNKE